MAARVNGGGCAKGTGGSLQESSIFVFGELLVAEGPHVYVVAQCQGAQGESDGLIGDRGGMDNG
jgi:hypothetical protein